MLCTLLHYCTLIRKQSELQCIQYKPWVPKLFSLAGPKWKLDSEPWAKSKLDLLQWEMVPNRGLDLFLSPNCLRTGSLWSWGLSSVCILHRRLNLQWELLPFFIMQALPERLIIISSSDRKEACFVQMILFIDSRQNRKREGVVSSREQTLAEQHTCDSQLHFPIESTCVNFIQNKKDQTGFFFNAC